MDASKPVSLKSRGCRAERSGAMAVLGKTFLRDAGPFKVVSVAGGWLRIEPHWSGHRPKDCAEPPKYGEEYWECPKCGTPHIAGFMSRMALASRVEELLNRLYAEAAQRPGAKRRIQGNARRRA